MEESEDVPPNYRASIVGRNTIMDLRADFCRTDTISFFFDFNFEGEEEKKRRRAYYSDIPYFASAWSRSLLYYVISKLGCSDRSRDLLFVWSETLYYHMDRVVRELRVPGSSDLRKGFFFKVDFAPTSPQAIEDLGMSADWFDAVPTGGNLLEPIELDDDDDSSVWKDGVCSICLDEFDYERRGPRGEGLTQMPCSHAFHYNCLAEWLPNSYTCPLCRYQLKWKTFVLNYI